MMKRVLFPALFIGFALAAFIGFGASASAEGEPGPWYPDPTYTANYQTLGGPWSGNILYLSVGYGEHISYATTSEIYVQNTGVVNIDIIEGTTCYRSQPGGPGDVDFAGASSFFFNTWYSVIPQGGGAPIAQIMVGYDCANMNRTISFNGVAGTTYELQATVVDSSVSGENLYRLHVTSGNATLGIGPVFVGGASFSNRDLPSGYETSYAIFFATQCTGAAIGAGGLTFSDADAQPGAGPYQSVGTYPNLIINLLSRPAGSGAAWNLMGSRNLTGGDKGFDVMPGVSFAPGMEFRLEILNLSRPNALEVLLDGSFSQKNVNRPCARPPVGYFDSCILSGNTTYLYGWAYDDDSANTNDPLVSSYIWDGVGAWVTGQDVNTDQGGYRTGDINAFLDANNNGSSNRNGVYGFRAAYNNLFVGNTYQVGGIVHNVGPSSSDQWLGVNQAGGAPSNGVPGSLGFPGNIIPQACLRSPSVAACNAATITFFRTGVSVPSVPAGATFKTQVTFTNPNPVTLPVNNVSYNVAGAPGGSQNASRIFSSPGDIAAGGSRTYSSPNPEDIMINGAGTFTVTWTIATPYGNTSCSRDISTTTVLPTCSAATIRFYRGGLELNPAQVAAGSNFRTEVTVSNSNLIGITVSSVTYAFITQPPSGNSNMTQTYNNPGNIAAGATRTYSSSSAPEDIILGGPGPFTVRWTINTSAGSIPCEDSIEATVVLPICEISPQSYQVGIPFRPYITLRNPGAIPVSIRADFPRVQLFNSGGGIVSDKNAIPDPGPGLPRSIPAGGALVLRADSDVNGIPAGIYSARWINVNASFGTPGYTNIPIRTDTNNPCNIDTTLLIVPYNRFYTADVQACGGGVVGSGSGTTRTSYRGSASQLAIFAATGIVNTMSGSQDGTPTPANNEVNRLSFSNSADPFGGNFGGSCNGYGIADFIVDSSTAPAVKNNINNLASGIYRYDDDGTDFGQQMFGQVRNRVIIHSTGNMWLGGSGGQDITYQGINNWGDVSDIPSLLIIAEGNVYIRSSTVRIDANIIAGGDIYTCADWQHKDLTVAQSDVSEATYLINNCNKKLTINGSMSANHIHFLRVNGGIHASPGAFEATTSGNIAEALIYNIETFLAPEGVFQEIPAAKPKLDSLVTRPITF